LPWILTFEGCPGPAADADGRGLPGLIDQEEPPPLEDGVGGPGGEPGAGYPDRRWPGGVRWPVGGRGRQEVGEAVVIVRRGCRGALVLLLTPMAAACRG
jgi:hypothetical protein